MSNISERLVVHCPYHEAPSYLAGFFAKYQVKHESNACIALHRRVKRFANQPSTIARSVVTLVYPLHSISDPDPRYFVIWARETGKRFPEIAGTLTFAKSSRDNCFDLIINSHYESPMLDASLSRLTFHGLAGDLLRSIGNHVESAWAHDEAARAGYSPLTHFTLDWSDTAKILELCGMLDRSPETNAGLTYQ
jgi:hypothetical protein